MLVLLGERALTERDEWASLVTHPGYLRLLEHARQEWVVGYPAKIKLAIQRNAGADVGAKVMAVDAAQDAVNALLSLPDDRIRRLDGQKEAAAVLQPQGRGGFC